MQQQSQVMLNFSRTLRKLISKASQHEQLTWPNQSSRTHFRFCSMSIVYWDTLHVSYSRPENMRLSASSSTHLSFKISRKWLLFVKTSFANLLLETENLCQLNALMILPEWGLLSRGEDDMASEERSRGFKRRKHTPSVPAINTRNVKSLDNIMDELRALIKTQKENGECSVMCSVEAFLHLLSGPQCVCDGLRDLYFQLAGMLIWAVRRNVDGLHWLSKVL